MKKQTHTIEIVALLLYASALILIMYYHEPWFDEAQAWLIARDATIRELLGSITHYEGHPPIWFFILMPFAKSGVPFEIGIKAVNFTIVTLAMGIFIFKAPFQRFIRCIIPFTYFFFYQYGVISRPYSLLMLGFVLSALMYKERNDKPFRFIAALSLICGSSAYGMLIAGGIAIVWLCETFGKSISLHQIKSFLKSRQFCALFILFIFNIFLLDCIYPFHYTYATTAVQTGSGVMLFYMFFMAPADAVCSLVLSNSTLGMNANFQMISSIIISCIIYFIIFAVTKKHQKRALFIVPYTLFAIFGGIVYFWVHHVGIIAMFYMFLLWCCFDEKLIVIKMPIIKTNQRVWEEKYLGIASRVLVLIIIGISIYWTIAASINEISFNYGTGRETAAFIKDNKLDQLNILVSWREIEDPTGKKYYDYNSLQGIPALAYFNRNIFYNFNHQLNNQCYLLHKIDKDGTYTEKSLQNAYPEVLLGNGSSTYTFGPEINMDDYSLVKSVHGNTIWKDNLIENRQFIFIRKDLLKNYPNLKQLNVEVEKLHE